MGNQKTLKLEYFALLAQDTGKEEEEFTTGAGTLQELFNELNKQYTFSLSDKQIKASINHQLASSWEAPISDGDHILFITPLAGG